MTRVTGGNLSNIDGLIRANGTANLFLLNPNGIIFCPNARLRIGGSFLATTATGFVFPNNYQFSATNPAPPLLTINVPIGLQFGNNPGRIEVRDAILRVPTLTSLALIGGNIVIDNATLFAPESRIELGSVASAGMVDINSIAPWRLSFTASVTRGDILLNNEAFLKATSIFFSRVLLSTTAPYKCVMQAVYLQDFTDLEQPKEREVILILTLQELCNQLRAAISEITPG